MSSSTSATSARLPSPTGRLIEQAAARGVHILCEKPLAPTLDDADHIARTVRSARVVFSPATSTTFRRNGRRYESCCRASGRSPLRRVRGAAHRGQRGQPQLGADLADQHGDLAGGGILVDHGAHIFYQLRAALGDPLTVQATVRRLVHQRYEVEDTALVTLDYGDRLAHVASPGRRGVARSTSASWARAGRLTGDDEQIVLRADRREEFRFDDGMSKNSSHSEWYAPLLREFSAQVREGGRSNEALDEAVHVTRIIERAYESARVGRTLPLVTAAPLSQTPVGAHAGTMRDAAGAPEP